MGSIEGNIGKIRILGVYPVFHPSQSRMKEEIGAEPFGFYDFLVVQKDIIKVALFFVYGEISPTGLANPAGSVDQNLVETTGFW